MFENVSFMTMEGQASAILMTDAVASYRVNGGKFYISSSWRQDVRGQKAESDEIIGWHMWYNNMSDA